MHFNSPNFSLSQHLRWNPNKTKTQQNENCASIQSKPSSIITMGKRGRTKQVKQVKKKPASLGLAKVQPGSNQSKRWAVLLALLAAAIAYAINSEKIKKMTTGQLHFNPTWETEQFTIPIQTAGELYPENVVILRNFLPVDVAEELHENMERAWRATKSDDISLESETSESLEDGNDSWLFTTNEGNKKIRSNANISSRHEKAKENLEGRKFSYSKWELMNKTNHELLLKELAKPGLRSSLEELPTFEQESIKGVADLFFTAYAKGNFLSIHDDGGSGSVALVVSFAKDWKEAYGGKLCFFCMDSMTYCKCVVPEFNSAIVFRSKPRHLYHAVTTVDIPDNTLARRYALTTWFVTDKDLKDPSLEVRITATKANIYMF